MLPVGQAFPQASVTSWYRNPAANFRAGGVADSQHLAAFAFDIDTPDRRDYAALADLGRRQGFVVVVESDHLHFQAFPARFQVVSRLRAAGLLRF